MGVCGGEGRGARFGGRGGGGGVGHWQHVHPPTPLTQPPNRPLTHMAAELPDDRLGPGGPRTRQPDQRMGLDVGDDLQQVLRGWVRGGGRVRGGAEARVWGGGAGGSERPQAQAGRGADARAAAAAAAEAAAAALGVLALMSGSPSSRANSCLWGGSSSPRVVVTRPLLLTAGKGRVGRGVGARAPARRVRLRPSNNPTRDSSSALPPPPLPPTLPRLSTIHTRRRASWREMPSLCSMNAAIASGRKEEKEWTKKVGGREVV